MNIILLQIGKTQDKNLLSLINIYEKRLVKYIKYESISLQDIKNASSLTVQQLKEKEGQLLMKHIKGKDFTILLDEKGKTLSSMEMAQFLSKKTNSSLKEICFIIGGAYGVSEEIKKNVSLILSISKMTFTHQMIRLLFTEQLYRAFTIIRNEPYHNY